jgi:hypothetical protein
MAALKEIEALLEATGETQISLTDPDARFMMTRGSGIVGYNVQTAVDAKYHLIATPRETTWRTGSMPRRPMEFCCSKQARPTAMQRVRQVPRRAIDGAI